MFYMIFRSLLYFISVLMSTWCFPPVRTLCWMSVFLLIIMKPLCTQVCYFTRWESNRKKQAPSAGVYYSMVPCSILLVYTLWHEYFSLACQKIGWFIYLVLRRLCMAIFVGLLCLKKIQSSLIRIKEIFVCFRACI